MLTRIDHVVIGVSDLTAGVETFTRMGFVIHPGVRRAGNGIETAVAFHQGDDHLELVGVRDRDAFAKAPAAANPERGLGEFIAAGGGLRAIALQSDDLAADVAAMRARGVDVSDATERAGRTPGGEEWRSKVAVLGAANPLPIFFVQHLTPAGDRRTHARAADHPNGVLCTDRVYIAVADVARAAETYGRVLRMAVPRVQRGNVIKADMAVFDLGPTGLTVAEPKEPGPAAEALARRGPGPFQVLYRTRSMDAAAGWMASHGMPPPARGIRNTGEHAMLVGPADACGAYVGFVGAA